MPQFLLWFALLTVSAAALTNDCKFVQSTYTVRISKPKVTNSGICDSYNELLIICNWPIVVTLMVGRAVSGGWGGRRN